MLHAIYDNHGKLTHVKVVDFPVPADSAFAGESMWVAVLRGDDNRGIGTLDNHPAFCQIVKAGDVVAYDHGTPDLKPSYVTRAFLTEDGYTFYWVGGQWVDNLNPDLIDMIYQGTEAGGPDFGPGWEN